MAASGLILFGSGTCDSHTFGQNPGANYNDGYTGYVPMYVGIYQNAVRIVSIYMYMNPRICSSDEVKRNDRWRKLTHQYQPI